MGDFLSQDEVDALLKGIIGPDDDDEEPNDPNLVKDYHLGTQERIIRGRMPTLELINERFARFLRIELFNTIHRNVELLVGPIRIQKYSEFVRNLLVPTNINVVNIKPFDSKGLFIFDLNLVFLVVDNVFGGDGRFHTRVEGRDFTKVEMEIIKILLKVVTDCYSKSFATTYPIEITYDRSEMNSQFTSIATPAEIVVSTSFTVELFGATADFHICYPYEAIESIRDILSSPFQPDSMLPSKTLTPGPLSTEMVIKSDLPNMTLSEVQSLKVGEILYFDENIGFVEVNGLKVFDTSFDFNNFTTHTITE